MMRAAFGKKIRTLFLASRRSQHIPKKDLLLTYQAPGLHIPKNCNLKFENNNLYGDKNCM